MKWKSVMAVTCVLIVLVLAGTAFCAEQEKEEPHGAVLPSCHRIPFHAGQVAVHSTPPIAGFKYP